MVNFRDDWAEISLRQILPGVVPDDRVNEKRVGSSNNAHLLALFDADQVTAEKLSALAKRGADALAIANLEDCRAAGAIGARLAVAEAEAGRAPGSIALMVIVDAPRLAAAPLGLAAAGPRLALLAFDPARLASRMGATPEAAPVAAARGLVVLAAAALGVPAALVVAAEAPDVTARASADGFRALMRRVPRAE